LGAAAGLYDGSEITGEGFRFSGPRDRVAVIWYLYPGSNLQHAEHGVGR
jgi:hypothetical protein